MTILARDAVASDHLVYAWPFPIGPECEVACAEDEQVVMCPAWMVGDRLGPGRHRWRTPDPSRPVGAFFVLTAPVEVSFDMVTSFMVPSTGQPVRVRASGSLQVRCADPGLLIAQFVGLPFDRVNDGVLRSVSRSVERMLARLLTRRVVMAGTPLAVTDPSMLPGVVEELVAYNPTAGAVFGVELIRMGHLVIVADDGSTPYLALPSASQSWPPNGQAPRANEPTTPPPIAARQGGGPRFQRPVTPVLETIRGMPAVEAPSDEVTENNPAPTGNPVGAVSGEIGGARASTPAIQGNPVVAVSGEIMPRGSSVSITPPQAAPTPAPTGNPVGAVSGEIGGARASTPAITPAPSTPLTPAPTGNPVGAVSGEIGSRRSSPVMETQPMPALTSTPEATPATTPTPSTTKTPPMGNPVGAVSGEIGGAKSTPRSKATLPPPIPSLPKKIPSIVSPAAAPPAEDKPAAEPSGAIAAGQRVLVPGPNGLMQSATVRQLLQGYYELEVGSSGETIWVPIAGVVPEQI